MVKPSKSFRLLKGDDPYSWQLVDEDGNDLFQNIHVTRFWVEPGSGPDANLFLEIPMYPNNINVDVVVKAKNIGINIVEHRVINYDLQKDG